MRLHAIALQILAALCWCLAGIVFAAVPQAEPLNAPLHIQRAVVSGLADSHTVDLPHMAARTDFAPEGSLLTYTLAVDLPSAPDKPMGIYVTKMALSGTLTINGNLYGACERGDLKNLRCLHRPYLFTTPPSFWKPGRNEISFQLYADARQSNGLSSVWVGDVDDLDKEFYRWRYWLQVELLYGLQQ